MQHRYFAAANSSDGFKNLYGEVFARADKVYIIKGGPGTGKSSLMKKCAALGEAQGLLVEYYYCSSDTESLDGVLIFTKSGTVGIVDGTAPHVWEPQQVGVREELLNLGQFWDSTTLEWQKNEIISLSHKKSAAYKRAYGYLRSCGNLCAVEDSLLKKAVDIEKMRRAAERTARSLGLDSGEGEVIPLFCSAVAMNGRVRLDSFEKNAEKVYEVSNFYGVGTLFLSELFGFLKRYDGILRVSYDPVNSARIDGIFLENIGVAFLLSDRCGSEDRVNCKRFVRQDALKEVRGELRYASRLYSDCLNGATHALEEARIYHFLLEDIYKNAMDFNALNEFSKGFVEKIFG